MTKLIISRNEKKSTFCRNNNIIIFAIIHSITISNEQKSNGVFEQLHI